MAELNKEIEEKIREEIHAEKISNHNSVIAALLREVFWR